MIAGIALLTAFALGGGLAGVLELLHAVQRLEQP